MGNKDHFLVAGFATASRFLQYRTTVVLQGKAAMHRPSIPSLSMWFVAIAMFNLSLIPLPSCAGTWDRAQEAFREYDDSRGLKLLEQAAEEGDVRAVQAWTLSVLHGQRFFPRLVKADDRQVLAWLEGVAEHCGRLVRETADSTWLCQKISAMKR